MKGKYLFGDHGLIYVSGLNAVLGWHEDMEKPTLLKNFGDQHCITSLAVLNGRLHHSDNMFGVFDTLSDKLVGEHNHGVGAIDMIGDQAIAARHNRELFTVRDGGNQRYLGGVVVYFLNDGKEIARLGTPEKEIQNHHEYPDLRYRIDSLDIATQGNIIYVTSDNAVSIQKQTDGSFKVEKLTDFLADHPLLTLGNGKVLSIYYQNDITHPDGTQVKDLLNNKRLTYWQPHNGPNGDGFGYSNMAALAGDVLVVGNWINGKNPKLFAVPITEEMISSENGTPSAPQLLLNNSRAASRMIGNNPMIAVPRSQLEQIIKDSD